MAKVGIQAYGVQVVCPLNTFRIQCQDYTDAKNPPISHRKGTFLSPSPPLYAKFVRLTRQEEQWGLYERPEVIGTREGWLTIGWPGGAPLRPSTGKKLVKARIRQQWL